MSSFAEQKDPLKNCDLTKSAGTKASRKVAQLVNTIKATMTNLFTLIYRITATDSVSLRHFVASNLLGEECSHHSVSGFYFPSHKWYPNDHLG